MSNKMLSVLSYNVLSWRPSQYQRSRPPMYYYYYYYYVLFIVTICNLLLDLAFFALKRAKYERVLWVLDHNNRHWIISFFISDFGRKSEVGSGLFAHTNCQNNFDFPPVTCNAMLKSVEMKRYLQTTLTVWRPSESPRSSRSPENRCISSSSQIPTSGQVHDKTTSVHSQNWAASWWNCQNTEKISF